MFFDHDCNNIFTSHMYCVKNSKYEVVEGDSIRDTNNKMQKLRMLRIEKFN